MAELPLDVLCLIALMDVGAFRGLVLASKPVSVWARNLRTERPAILEKAFVEKRVKKKVISYFMGEIGNPFGPAIIYSNGAQIWMLNGKKHRENGPAMICSNGCQHFYRHGKYIGSFPF